MKEWVQKQIDSGFSDFAGLSITASIPVKDGLVNELLAETLRSAPDPATAPTGSIDVRSLLKFVEKAEIHASDGVIVLDVAIKI